MNAEELKSRTKKLAIGIIKFVDELPKSTSHHVIGKQLIRSATSVAANYRAACKARSKPDFINKLGVVEEEADETLFWLELLVEAGKSSNNGVAQLKQETLELVKIFPASRITAKKNR
ncbi:MAG: four helix bundle protein [Ignavibacteriae bacterium]|nr:four helix bundle protein [Ignavibacteriota bacterium]